MNVAADGNYNLKILNDAFEGRAAENEDIELVNEMGEMKIKTRQKRPPKPEQPASKAKKLVEERKVKPKPKTGPAVDPRVSSIVDEVMRQSQADFKNMNYKDQAIEEEDDEDEGEEVEVPDYSWALVPVDDEKIKKKRNELLKKKAKAVKDKSKQTRVGKVLFDVDADGTFVTGVGIPGRTKNKELHETGDQEEQKQYIDEEDLLLEKIDRTEKDLYGMMKYMDKVEDLM